MALGYAEQLTVLANWTSDNNTVVIQADPSTRASGRVRGASADFFELMQALDAQTPHLPDTRVLSEQRRVPVYASPFDKPAGAWGEDGPGTAVTPGFNESVDRFKDMFNFVSAATVAKAIFQRSLTQALLWTDGEEAKSAGAGLRQELAGVRPHAHHAVLAGLVQLRPHRGPAERQR